MKKHGGARIGSGRKKGIGSHFTIKKVFDQYFTEMLEKILSSDEIMDIIKKDAVRFSKTSVFTGDGYIYLIKNKNLFKIGSTSSPKARLSHYMVSNPEIQLVYLLKCESYEKREIELHKRFAHLNTVGEWFKLSHDDVLNIIIEFELESKSKLIT